MKKMNVCALLLCIVAAGAVFAGGKQAAPSSGGANDGTAGAKKYRIGIAKIVQHVALDDIEKGIIDRLGAEGVQADYDLQNANGDVNTAAQIATKYEAEKVDVAVGIATPIAVALATAIKDIPVVFATVTDPLGAGLVTTLAHGEGNVTGMSDAIPTDEHIKMFQEIAGIKTLGYIYTASEANSASSYDQVEAACKKYGITLVAQPITASSEVKQASDAIVKRVDGIYLTNDNTVFSALPALVAVFTAAKKPVFSADVTSARLGGCMLAAGFNYYKAGYATGKLVADVLRGAKPADIPVLFMTDPKDSDFLVDLDAAKLCGITIPQKYLDAANLIYQNGKLTEK